MASCVHRLRGSASTNFNAYVHLVEPTDPSIRRMQKLTQPPITTIELRTLLNETDLERQEAEIKHWRRNQELEIPLSIEYKPEVFPCLSSEELEKLQYTRPRNFQEASQISGLTPHSLVYLYQQVRKGKVCG